jgi:hypothetical protein
VLPELFSINAPAGRVRTAAELPGFKNYVREIKHDAAKPVTQNFAMDAGNATETLVEETSVTFNPYTARLP